MFLHAGATLSRRQREGLDDRSNRPYANMHPLTLTGRVVAATAPSIWAANRALVRVPWINRVATNIELVALDSLHGDSGPVFVATGDEAPDAVRRSRREG